MTTDRELEALHARLRADVTALRAERDRLSRKRAAAGPQGFGQGLVVGAVVGAGIGAALVWVVIDFFRHFPGG